MLKMFRIFCCCFAGEKMEGGTCLYSLKRSAGPGSRRNQQAQLSWRATAGDTTNDTELAILAEDSVTHMNEERTQVANDRHGACALTNQARLHTDALNQRLVPGVQGVAG
ncbi:hypothetical protein [Curvibacter gracilis]|uniref:hypothetical protein n=1 Tax=Curvibacter gracilis TaxID=230310 RepID=UPI0012F7F522|nr:hypothetical protein [Curvibacter gracilis]